MPHPVISIGPFSITFELEQPAVWSCSVSSYRRDHAFYRLEGSRLGRAWAAIREDEVAAQASGVITAESKLLAFAIGASTSGLAGVFFASQVGYFNPDNFILNNSILVVAYVVFGGMGSLPGRSPARPSSRGCRSSFRTRYLDRTGRSGSARCSSS